jgi:copper homeostasis protein
MTNHILERAQLSPKQTRKENFVKTPVLLEVCVDSAEAAAAAQQGGANRVELCADLLEGGITPSSGTIRITRQQLTIPMNVLIRPRGGDFCYSSTEFEVMKLNINHAKELGADGIVMGILNPDGTIDSQRTRTLIELARPMEITFHRAFDMARDPLVALETLVELGVDRLLTSGQEATVWEGIELISELVQQAEERIIVMPGGGINVRNVGRIIAHSGATEFHASARTNVDSPMAYRHGHVFIGGALRPAEYTVRTTRSGDVEAFMAAMKTLSSSSEV